MWCLCDPTPSGWCKTDAHSMDFASNWLERLLAGSISTWEDLTTRFLAQFFPPGRTAKIQNDILMFQQHQGESFYEAWTHFKDLLRKVPYHGIDLWLQKKPGPPSRSWLDMRTKDETIPSEDVCGMTSDMMCQLPPEPSCQEALEDLVMRFILDQEAKVKQLEEYMSVIGSDFMKISLEVVEKLKDEIRVK
ncbi:zinc finger, CCHC-type containing protein [Tanacetum coccineum]